MRGLVRTAGAAALLTAVAVAEAPSPPAQAPPDAIIQRISGEDLLGILQEVGFTGEVGQTSDGNPLISAGYADPETKANYRFLVTLYRCEDGACFDLVFTRSHEAPMPVTLQMVNKYNQTRLFGVAYLDAGGLVGQSLSHTIQGGVTRQTVKEIIDWWRSVMVSLDDQLKG